MPVILSQGLLQGNAGGRRPAGGHWLSTPVPGTVLVLRIKHTNPGPSEGHVSLETGDERGAWGLTPLGECERPREPSVREGRLLVGGRLGLGASGESSPRRGL